MTRAGHNHRLVDSLRPTVVSNGHGRVEPVHHRHLAVHKDQAVVDSVAHELVVLVTRLHQLNCLLAILRLVYRIHQELVLLELLQDDLKTQDVEGLVVYYENPLNYLVGLSSKPCSLDSIGWNQSSLIVEPSDLKHGHAYAKVVVYEAILLLVLRLVLLFTLTAVGRVTAEFALNCFVEALRLTDLKKSLDGLRFNMTTISVRHLCDTDLVQSNDLTDLVFLRLVLLALFGDVIKALHERPEAGSVPQIWSILLLELDLLVALAVWIPVPYELPL